MERVRMFLFVLINADDLFRMRNVNRPDNNAVDDRKNCGVRADPESQHHDGNGREPWIFSEHPHSVTNVPEKILNPIEPALIAASFLDRFCKPKFLQRRATRL